MKKSLLLLFSLLIFVGNVWGWTEGIKDSDDALTVGKTREYQLPSGKSKPNKFNFSAASGLYWFDYSVNVYKYTGSSCSIETINFSGAIVQTYHNATVTLDNNVDRVVIENNNDAASVYIHDVVWEGIDPAVGNCKRTSDNINTTTLTEKSLTISNLTYRRPVITFDYSATKFLSISGSISLTIGNEKNAVWSTKEHGLSGSCSYTVNGNPNKVKISYWGKVSITNIKITQSSYAEIKNKSDISFGEMKTIGSTWTDKSFNVQWASYNGNVTCTSNQFSVTPTSIGSNSDCDYNDNQTITVSFNPTQPGLHTGYVYVGNDKVKVTGEAQLATPDIDANATGKGSVAVSWSESTGAASYSLYYANGDLIQSNITSTSYTVTGLEQNTKYGFKVKAFSGVGDKYDSEMSDVEEATTYSKLTVEKAGEYAGSIGYSVSGEDGKWNITETSFAKNSIATITANCSNTCAVFDKILAGGTSFANPAKITMTAPTTATISYKLKTLDKPVVSISDNNSKSRISINWEAVGCADSYTVYNNGVEVESGVTETSYEFNGLDEATTYSFSVKAVRGTEESVKSDAVPATTYTTNMSATITGVFGSEGDVNITGTEWNQSENSYAIGSTATVSVSSLHQDCVVESIVANGTDITSTAAFTVQAENTVTVTYKYVGSGIAQVIDEHGNVVYGTLTDAVNAAEDGASINLLGDVEQDMVVNKFIRFNGNGHDIDNLYIKENGNMELTGDVTVVKDFGLEISATRSGQFVENGGQIAVTGKAYIDKAFDASGVGSASKWYSLAVPFPVSVTNGMSKIVNNVETSASAGVDIDIFKYDGVKRAQTTTGKPNAWDNVKSGYLTPGTFYLIGLVKNGPNVFRFYKDDAAELVTLSKQIELKEFPSANPKHAGWNGIGNSQLYHVGVSLQTSGYAQILEGNKFMTIDLNEIAFAVTTPLFIQSDADSYATLSHKNDGSLRSAIASSETYNLRISMENAAQYSDQMFVNASDATLGTYTIGHDLAKMEVSTAYPQIYTRAFDTNLSVHEAAYDEKNVAEIPLYMYAPVAGNYTLSLGRDVLDGSNLYLIKDGVEIHNFNEDGAYTLYLAKGTSSNYTLRIAGFGNGNIITPVNENGDTNAIKVYINEGVLTIEGLSDGETFAVGNIIRTLYYGKSTGSEVRITLIDKGVYWVNAGDKKIKVLNK